MRTRSNQRGAFELFPALPPELRRKIWKETIRTTPRLLPSKPIPELTVCREARSVLLEVYQPCFKSLPPEEALLDYPISLYANFALDIVLFDTELADCELWERQFSDFLEPEAIGKIQHLAIEDTDWRELDPEDGFNRQEGQPDPRFRIVELTGLKTLSLVLTSVDPFLEDDDDSLVPIDRERGTLIKARGDFIEDDFLTEDACDFLENLEKMRPEWVPPQFQLARVVYN